ncbi:MAG: hypothetical protein JWN43_4871 [Gammaproteobacteria bacterium]|nr:hypothetical protein [Gammaproteobacteria bacterium]
MFTQCSKCETVFRLSAEALRAAGGQVRCGRCGDVFNALARLAEDATSFTKGESSFELETRADEILQTLQPVGPVEMAPHPEQIARLQILEPLEDEVDLEASLEFTLPPGELDRIFIETPPGFLQRFALDDGRASPAVVPADAPAATQASSAAPASSAGRASSAAKASPRAPASPPASPPAALLPAAPPAAVSLPVAPLAAASRRTAPGRGRVSGLEVSEDVRREMLSSYAHAELPEINSPRRRLPPAAWVGAAAVLAVLLAFQVIRSSGGWSAARATLLGGSSSGSKLSAYQLRQWGVTGDPGAKGTLRVRASIMNTAAQLQPYPLLRVTLANRFGTRIGQREFEPAEYLGKPTANLLAPGERIDATMDILDPGKDAEGFEIDVCVRGPGKKVLCAGDSAAAGGAATGAAAPGSAPAGAAQTR